MIQIEDLHKAFDGRTVLDGLSVSIPEGQATGLVGPNGAGKTTLIKMILGLVKPDAGSVKINGKLLNGDWLYRQQIGYMPQVARYPESMQAHELFTFITGLRDQEPICLEELVELFNLAPELHKPLRVLSGGNRQKVGATLAMMFNPSLLFFDEPTAGLDPQASYAFKERVQREKEAGKTVVITSHIMSELEQLVDHVMFILDGKVRYYGSTEALLEVSREERLEGAIARMMAGAAR